MASETQEKMHVRKGEIRIHTPRRRADMATILGLLVAIGLISVALMLGGSPQAFIDIRALLIVVLGTIAVTAISFTGQDFFRTLRIMGKSLFRQELSPNAVAKQLMDIAVIARTEGILALKKSEKELEKDNFIFRGILMAQDGHTSAEIEHILGQEIDSLVERHQKGVSILRRGAEAAPAMGLIGTIIGLVQMLTTLDDPSTIGPSMAIALLTTFYGALLGTVILSPMASKLEMNSQTEALLKTLIINGLTSIARQENPRRLEMILNSDLPPSERINYFD